MRPRLGRMAHPVQPMMVSGMLKSAVGALVAMLMFVPGAQAQEKKNAQVVDLPVFAGDGIKIGRVSDVSMADGRVDQIRVSTGSAMGFGERIVTIPQPAFTIKGDMVLIPDLSAEDIQALPSDPSENHGLRHTRHR
jgi:sporulation protein YlmC with PRC-barrel domain